MISSTTRKPNSRKCSSCSLLSMETPANPVNCPLSQQFATVFKKRVGKRQRHPQVAIYNSAKRVKLQFALAIVNAGDEKKGAEGRPEISRTFFIIISITSRGFTTRHLPSSVRTRYIQTDRRSFKHCAVLRFALFIVVISLYFFISCNAVPDQKLWCQTPRCLPRTHNHFNFELRKIQHLYQFISNLFY